MARLHVCGSPLGRSPLLANLVTMASPCRVLIYTSLILNLSACLYMFVFLHISVKSLDSYHTKGFSDTAMMKNEAKQRRTSPYSLKSLHFGQSIKQIEVLDTVDDDDDIWPPRKALSRLADNHHRLVVTFVNCAYLEFADNWAKRLETLGVTNYALIPLDNRTEVILKETYPNHVLPRMQQVSEAPTTVATFGSSNFAAITASRPLLLKSLIETGYTIFYNDADTVWCRNVWNYPFQQFTYQMDGQPGYRCTCLLYLTPQDSGVLQEWQGLLKIGKHDQQAFNTLNWDNVNASVLNATEFPAGNQVAWKVPQLPLEKRVEYILHINYVSFYNKKKRLESVGAWNPSGKITLEHLQSCKRKT